jgi:hypothetical protein
MKRAAAWQRLHLSAAAVANVTSQWLWTKGPCQRLLLMLMSLNDGMKWPGVQLHAVCAAAQNHSK